ncbi:Gfo/Idh/MocA family oxidoreductase [Flagellimonas halotolerans]|uniref:Gfo/Idh/MocA family oxidoreductase n=1 Tax=Flagellimonas halotolerans TaxID=3112164 RepID=A0ABU6IUS0_9FLAO|nr:MULTISPECIES: Gfo/Idh/MocA family oxidoreductase [unclassified Allomuricauda]MEC3967017.1 Gfo/Idh/MocA family oxidoreductase [Muricauda sp. SYSU M86414]MEC4266880.1 Gfo/Idh/MocA family oxidoreductase [Muricauda sp. SYSU M84420]
MKDKRNRSRRNFVKNTALLSAGMVLPSMEMEGMANVFNNRKLKLALVGCGGRGTGAANQALQADEHIELVAMADAFEDRLTSSYNSLAEKYINTGKINVKEKNKFYGFDAYKKAIDLADVVILATPPGFRPYHFAYAIENGKHVFMEKPVATDVPGVRKVLEAAKLAEEKKLNVVVGLQRRYQENYLKTLEKIKEGDVGKIVSGQVYWNSSGVWVKPRKPGQTELEYQMRNWYYFNWLCGDHILEQHIHNIDVANWFIGEYPESAQGMGGRLVRTGPDHGEIYDHHFVEFTYPSGAIISSQCRHQPNTMYRVGEAFQGTKGTVSTNDAGIAKIYGLSGNELHSIANSEGHNPYQVEHDRLFASIRNKGVINDAEIGAKSTMSAIMGRMATYSGKIITWDEAIKSEIRLMPEAMTWDSQPPSLPNADGNYPIPIPGKGKVL